MTDNDLERLPLAALQAAEVMEQIKAEATRARHQATAAVVAMIVEAGKKKNVDTQPGAP